MLFESVLKLSHFLIRESLKGLKKISNLMMNVKEEINMKLIMLGIFDGMSEFEMES